MNKRKIKHIKSTAIPLSLENIDTDQIIPARFLKSTVKDGYGKNLFRDWRYDAQGKIKPDFVLNSPKYSGTILIAGYNFGCGSSREHAAWALADYGFLAVVSSFFADIFKNNSLNNNLLPVQVSKQFLKILFQAIQSNPKTVIEIDIEKQEVAVPELKKKEQFEINPYKKICLMNGYDDINYLLEMKNKIRTYENNRLIDWTV